MYYSLIAISLLISGLLSLPVQAQDELLFLHPSKLPGSVNSSMDETHLSFDNNLSNLYFVRQDKTSNISTNGLWKAHLDNGKNWTQVENYLESISNKKEKTIKNTANHDLLQGRTRNVAQKRRKNRLYLHHGDNWTPNTTIYEIEGFTIDGPFTYHINSSEDVLLISENRKSEGNSDDIYVSLKQTDGLWKKPFSLGDAINTSGSEISPYLSNNSDTLYFASDGHQGFGEKDIFYSVRLDGTWKNWSKPTNLGTVINSEYSEAYFIRNKNSCYFASNKTGNFEIYTTEVYQAAQVVFNIETKTDVSIKNGNDGSITLINLEADMIYDKIVFYHDEDSTTVTNVKTNAYGMVLINGLIPGSYHHFEAFKGSRKAICLDDVMIREPGSIVQSTVTPRGIPRPAIEEVIEFDENSSYLSTLSIEKLNNLINKMLGSPYYKVVIFANYDESNSDGYDNWLAERRLKRIAAYLTNHDIDSDKIESTTLGNVEFASKCNNCQTENHKQLSLIRVSF